MRLEWKYTLLINIFILVTMSSFFLIDDAVLRRENIQSAIRDYKMGVAMREAAVGIQKRVESIPDKYDENLTRAIRSLTLHSTDWEIADINVTDAQGVVIASLTGEAVNDQLDNDALQRVVSGQMRVKPTKGYYGHWVIEYTLPYLLEFSDNSPDAKAEIGAIQIMFSVQGIVKYAQRLRIKRLFYFAIVTITLTVFINPLTSHLIVRRLERLMEATTAAQSGGLAARTMDASRDEIGRLSRSINRMIERISSEHDSRIKSLGNLAAGVAHEVRNPLNSIAITIQYLKEIISEEQNNEDERSEMQECLDVMARQVKELNRIVEEFLQLSRPNEMVWKYVDLNAFMAETVSNFNSFLEIGNIKLIESYCDGLLVTRIDSDKLRQAISNVLLNAIQAMPDGGQLYIRTFNDNAYAVIEIRDTGVGISQENMGRLFEPYFTTKPDGTGLGLAITYKIIEAHGGEIKVASEEGHGANFTIILPSGGKRKI